MHMREPSQMWEKLRSLFESKSTNRRLALKNQLYNLRMSDKQSAEEHLRNFNAIVAQLANINTTLEDDELIDRLLMSLPNSWSNFVNRSLSEKINQRTQN